jgi:hypothetical protein
MFVPDLLNCEKRAFELSGMVARARPAIPAHIPSMSPKVALSHGNCSS